MGAYFVSIRTGPTNYNLMQRRLFLLSLQIFKIVHCLDCIKFQNYLSFCKTSTVILNLTTHCNFLLVNPYRYLLFCQCPFHLECITRLNLDYTLPCYLQVIVDESFLLSMFLVFLSFVPLCKGEHYYGTLLLCILHRAKLIQFNSIQRE